LSAATFQSEASGLDFLPQKSIATPRGTYVHADYIARAHRGNELKAIVTYQGKPVEDRGQVLRVGMVPPERRYAIGPALEGRAELLGQLDFERAHEESYVKDYEQVKDGKLDDVSRRHIPNVRAFVSVTVHPQDQRRLLPLGQPVEGGAPPEAPDTFWSNTLNREVTQAEAVKMSAGPDPRDAAITELTLALDKLQQQIATMQADPGPQPAPARPKKALLAAPCGKQMTTGLPMHIKHCKKPECAEARAGKE
jgi:hypothetical protein